MVGGCGTHFVPGQLQADLFAAGHPRGGPPGEGDLAVDELAPLDVVAEVVPLVIEFVLVPAILATAIRYRVTGFVHVDQREDSLATRGRRCSAQLFDPLAVGSLEAARRQAALGVFVVEQECQPSGSTVVIPTAKGVGEILGEERRSARDRLCRSGFRRCGEQQVEGEGDSVTGAHRPHLVPAIGVEGNEDQFVAGPSEDPFSAAVVDHQLATGVDRRQGDHESGDHLVVLLGILVRQEELALAVDEHRVEFGPQGGVRRQTECLAEAIEHRLELQLPLVATEGHLVGRQLPGVAHRCVVECFPTAAVCRRAGDRDQLLRLGGADRQGARPRRR
nr:hypothetical protein [Flexivirga caeni]